MELTREQFITIAKESGLLGPAQLNAMLQERGREGGLPDAQGLADALVEMGSLSPWQADKLLAGVEKGFFLAQYKLLRLIASGSMSSVYEAEHVGLRKRVALKVLPKGLMGEASFLERFYREAQTVARLDHPNIIRGFDVGQDGDYHYFVMEFLKGSTLEELVEKSGPLPFETAADLIRQAALGLEHAHKSGLVHRDIKPANLFQDLDGVVKILDLGLVRTLSLENDQEAGLTRLHDECVLGTVDYLSPEQAIDSHEVDIRSDIYSLGCTLYYLLTGTPPFSKGALAERLLAHQTRSPSPLSIVRPDIPKGLGQIVGKMLAKKPEERYQVPAELAEALAGWLEAFEAARPHRKHEAAASGPHHAGADHTPRKGSSLRKSKPSSGERSKSKAPNPSREHAVLVAVAAAGAGSGSNVGDSAEAIAAEPPTLGDVLPELATCWGRWAKVVETLSSKALLRSTIGEAAYKALYEELRHVCRVSAVEADEPTLKVLRQIEDLIGPWMTLRSLRGALGGEMCSSIVRRFGEIDQVIRPRPKKKPSARIPLKFVASVAALMVTFSGLFAYRPDLANPRVALSLITEARLSINKLTNTTLDYVNQQKP